MSGDLARHLLAGDGLTACGIRAGTLTPRTLTTFRSAVTCTACQDGATESPSDAPDACDCGECYYVTPDCCGEPRPRCETGSAHDYYVCSRGKGCDADRDRDAEADALLARMLLNP